MNATIEDIFRKSFPNDLLDVQFVYDYFFNPCHASLITFSIPAIGIGLSGQEDCTKALSSTAATPRSPATGHTTLTKKTSPAED